MAGCGWLLGGAHLGVFLDGDEGADREPDGALSVDVQVGRLLAALLPAALPLHAAQLYIDNVYSTGKYFCFVWPPPVSSSLRVWLLLPQVPASCSRSPLSSAR